MASGPYPRVADLQLIHRDNPIFFIPAKLSFSAHGFLLDWFTALLSHFPDGRALYRDPSLNLPVRLGFPVGVRVIRTNAAPAALAAASPPADPEQHDGGRRGDHSVLHVNAV